MVISYADWHRLRDEENEKAARALLEGIDERLRAADTHGVVYYTPDRPNSAVIAHVLTELDCEGWAAKYVDDIDSPYFEILGPK